MALCINNQQEMQMETEARANDVQPDVKYLDPQELIDSGTLHEINRLVLHPLGMALQVNPNTGWMKVWDCRADEEGVYFDESALSLDKALAVRAQMFERRNARIKALGYVIQGFPEHSTLTTNYTDPDYGREAPQE